ncbi:MAG: EamA family transporter [Caldilineaceae bacterium]
MIGLPPVLWWEWQDPAFSTTVWILLVVTGICQASYYVGLAMGYQRGDFTVVYPLVRALPVLFVAYFDVIQGYQPSPLAWLGMILVTVGCLLIPHQSLRTLHWHVYRSQTMIWVLVAALGTIGYSAVDKTAAALMAPGAGNAARYFVMELVFCIPPFIGALALLRQPIGLTPWRHGWRWPLLTALGTFLSYWLILWAFQDNVPASYIVAMRQISIVMGTLAGTVLFHEPARGADPCRRDDHIGHRLYCPGRLNHDLIDIQISPASC